MPDTYANDTPRLLPKPPFAWESLYAAGIFCLFCFRLLALLLPRRCADLQSIYGLILLGVLLGAYLAKRGLSDGPAFWLMLAWAAWLLISRWLNGDVYLFVDRSHFIDALATLLLISAGLVLDRERRERLLRWITLVYAGFFVLFTAAALFAAVTNATMRVSIENVWVGTYREGSILALNVLSSFRLVTAFRLYVAWALLLLCCFRTKSRFKRGLCLMGMLILHLGTALCFSRSTQMCFAFGAAALAFLLCHRHFYRAGALRRFGLSALLFLAAFVLAYKSFDLCNDLTSRMNTFFAPRFEAFYNSLEQPPDPDLFGIRPLEEVVDESVVRRASAKKQPQPAESAAPDASAPAVQSAAPDAAAQDDAFVEQRSIKGNWTLSERTLIWASILPSVREKPSILFIGQSGKGMMDLPNKYIVSVENKNHMHNAFLQVFMLTGLPGFLIVAAWTILLLRGMLRSFFADPEKLSLGAALLVLPLAATLLFNLVEISIAPLLDVGATVFYLLAGVQFANRRDAESLS